MPLRTGARAGLRAHCLWASPCRALPWTDTTIETNIQQGVELLLTAAQLCMALTGYSALGGCECGCGVSCKVVGYDHARWVCPGSVGYTCADPDDNLGAALLFGDEPGQAP